MGEAVNLPLTLMDSTRGRDGRDRRRVARARAWSRGASRWPRRSGRRSATRTTGAGPCPGSATRARTSSSSAWRPPPTARTAPVGCSPATARATGSTARCIGPASPTSRRATSRDDGLRLTDAYITAAGALRAAGQQADARGARHVPAVPAPRAGAARPTRGVSWRSVRSRYEALCRVLGVRPRPRFGHGVEVSIDGRPHDPVLVPPQPAEHLHRQAHPRHARRRVHPRRRAWALGRDMRRQVPNPDRSGARRRRAAT